MMLKKTHLVYLMLITLPLSGLLSIFLFSKVHAEGMTQETTPIEIPATDSTEKSSVIEEKPAEVTPQTIIDETTLPQNPPVAMPTAQLFDKSTLTKTEQSTSMIHPRFNDGSTTIAFYAECPTVACPNNGTPESPEYIFFAENSGHGELPFSNYWTPDASFRKLVAVEYSNASHQFTCSNLSLKDCIANSHFINESSININADN